MCSTLLPPTQSQARTIDLCNNPLTKEPKLNSARRIIREWPDLNREAQEFTQLVRFYFSFCMQAELCGVQWAGRQLSCTY